MLIPNWRFSYDGLSKIDLIKEYCKSVTLNHAYTCTYNIGSFQNNVDYNFNQTDGFAQIRTDLINLSTDFPTQYLVRAVLINEQFAPLIGVDVALFKNSITTRFEYRKMRNLNLVLSNDQITGNAKR